ncbi:MAG: flagellar biosynthesis protein FlhB [Abditibacteriales bacterium]|nr:flagellar biosynthesis protein FlhB [Abditibacteriales bacterium]MDW8365138.1 flagellar biosynthesis protein FlhB [Abditibacteriales bacterium]
MAFTDRTEAATPRRRQEVRQRGQVARSVELSSAFILTVCVIVLRYSVPWLFTQLEGLCARTLTHWPESDWTIETVHRGGLVAFLHCARLSAPIWAAAMLAGIAINLAQVGFLLTLEPLKPDFNRINPITGFGRLFSTRGGVELVKSVLKVALVSAVAFFTARSQLPLFISAAQMDTPESLRVLGGILYTLCLRVCVAMLLLAALDYIYQRVHFEQSIRMTREEVREEMRQLEGDPTLRARIRQRQRQIARQRMMQAVPRADVVVTNPTRLAVALRYVAGEMRAPTVVAKGQRLMAERIRAVARQHGVPIVENEPLAQALFKAVDVGQEIPAALYQAVAEVLAFVYRLKQKSVP